MAKFKQSKKTLDEIPPKYHKFAELLAEGVHSKRDCSVLAGFSESFADSRSSDAIGPSRERSKYPALWDYYQSLRDRKLRLFDLNAGAIQREFKIIAFSKITDFVHIPTRADLERQKFLDAKVRQANGFSDEEDRAILGKESEILRLIAEDKAAGKELKHHPGASVRLKILEDIPDELIPAIQSIQETPHGIKIRLHNKLEALDRLARMQKLYDADGEDKKATVIEKLILNVQGSQSDLLKDLDKI